jgi:hypothetical protein
MRLSAAAVRLRFQVLCSSWPAQRRLIISEIQVSVGGERTCRVKTPSQLKRISQCRTTINKSPILVFLLAHKLGMEVNVGCEA